MKVANIPSTHQVSVEKSANILVDDSTAQTEHADDSSLGSAHGSDFDSSPREGSESADIDIESLALTHEEQDDISTTTDNSKQTKENLFECNSTNQDNNNSETTDRRSISFMNEDSKDKSGEDIYVGSTGKSGLGFEAIHTDDDDACGGAVWEDAISDKSLEISEAQPKTTLALIIENVQVNAGADHQETTTHQELERLITATAAKDEELAARDGKIAELEQQLSDMIQQFGHKDRARDIIQLNEKLHGLASTQAKIMETLSSVNTIAHVVTDQTAARGEQEATKCKIKNYVKKLEDRIKISEGSTEEAEQLKISIAKLQAKNMEVIGEKEILTKQLEMAEESMARNRNIKTELDAAKADYHHAKHRTNELEAILSDMEHSHEQLGTEARNHQEHRSILSSKVRYLEGEIARLTDKLKILETEQPKGSTFAQKKGKKRKTTRKEQVSPQTDNSFDLDMYVLAIKSSQTQRRSKIVKAAAVAIFAAFLGIIVACGKFPADSGMSEGYHFCKPTYKTVAWLAGTNTLITKLQATRQKSEELKAQNAKLDDLLRDKDAMIQELIENHKIDREVTMEQILQFKRKLAGSTNN